jgi:predicted PurR-regulated permease PerM
MSGHPPANGGPQSQTGSGRVTQQLLDELHAEAAAEAGASGRNRFGLAGRRFDRRAPFLVGFYAAAGGLGALAFAYCAVAIGQILVLCGLALFLAAGLDPPVRWLARHGLPRPVAVTVALGGAIGVLAVLVAFAAPVVVTQTSHLAADVPRYLHSLENRRTTVGKLNAKYHIVGRLQKLLEGGGTSLGTVLGAGKVALNLLGSVILVLILSAYFLADFPHVKRGLYRLAPRSRRARVVLLTDEILDRVGGYVLGKLFTSLVAGVGTFVWALVFGIPYALFLGLLVAFLDLIPIVGSTVGGVIVSLIALTVSVPVAIATAVFYLLYRFFEDFLLTPRVMSRAVDIPGLATVLATVIGGALLGIVGALVAIPVAAALKLLLDHVAAPTLDNS